MALEDFKPETKDVALHMQARLYGEHGKEFADFSEETNPTKAQVEALLDDGAARVAGATGATICEGDHQEALYAQGRAVAALYVAMVAERSYYPEQIGSGRSPYKDLREDFKEGLKTLVEAVSEHCGGGGGDPGDSVGPAAAMPSYAFPCPRRWEEEVF